MHCLDLLHRLSQLHKFASTSTEFLGRYVVDYWASTGSLTHTPPENGLRLCVSGGLWKPLYPVIRDDNSLGLKVGGLLGAGLIHQCLGKTENLPESVAIYLSS